jgi:hypothetical protein
MDLYSIVEGPLLWTVFLVFLAGLLIRFSSFLCSVILCTRSKQERSVLIASLLARYLSTFHKAFAGKPPYSAPVRAAERPVWEILAAASPEA